MPHLQSDQTLIDFFTNENAGIGFADFMSATLRDSYHLTGSVQPSVEPLCPNPSKLIHEQEFSEWIECPDRLDDSFRSLRKNDEYLSIHRKLFTGIYPHAGRIRDYNITKKEWVLDGATVLYGSATELRATLDYDFSEEKKFSYMNLTMDEIIHHLAVFVSRLWQIHVFGEGNTRVTAVFFIKYLRTLGFDVTNDIFAENAWYFRNSLVRANYNDLKNSIHETTEYLELFLRNLLLNENHSLHNRTLHISGTIKETEKPDIGTTKPDIEELKADIEKVFQPKTVSHILKLREAFPGKTIFGRSDVMGVIDIKPSRASDLLKDMVEHRIIESVFGHGKGKYRFRNRQG